MDQGQPFGVLTSSQTEVTHNAGLASSYHGQFHGARIGSASPIKVYL